MAKVSRNRIFVGFSLITLVMIANYFGAFVWAAFIALIALLGYQEYEHLCALRDIKISKILMRIAIVLFIFAPLFTQSNPENMFVSQAVLIAFTAISMIYRLFTQGKVGFTAYAVSIWGALYLGFLPSFLVWIRELEHGFALITIFVFTVGLNDVSAMFVGKAIGKAQLSPEISPGKTVEGSLAGLFTATVCFYLMVHVSGFELQNVSDGTVLQTAVLLVLGLLLGFIAQVGDLLESLFKRGVGVKDSGSIFLSHGGVLDRTDSHFATAWLAYLIFVYLFY